MMLRSFIAFSLDEQTVNWLEDSIDELKSLDKQCEIRWVTAENLHLTLSFLDNIDEDFVEPLGYELAKTMQGQSILEVEVNEIGYAPFMSKSRFVVANVQLTTELTRVQKKVEQAVRSVGIPLQKRNFKPHITIGRSRLKNGAQLMIPPITTKRNIELSCVRVYESALRHDGAYYEPLVEIDLGSL